VRKLILFLAAVSLVLLAEKSLCRQTTFSVEPEAFNSFRYAEMRAEEAAPPSIRTGRFLSVDPGKDWDPKKPQSWNMYAYVRSNPINSTDPSGRCTVMSGWLTTCQQVAGLLVEKFVDMAANSGIGNVFEGARTGDLQRTQLGQAQMTREMLTVGLLASMEPVNTRSVQPSPADLGTVIGHSLRGQKNRMGAIVQKVNAAGLTQEGAATAAESAVRATGKATAGNVRVGDDLIVTSARVGQNQYVLVVDKAGHVRKGFATIEIDKLGKTTVRDVE